MISAISAFNESQHKQQTNKPQKAHLPNWTLRRVLDNNGGGA